MVGTEFIWGWNTPPTIIGLPSCVGNVVMICKLPLGMPAMYPEDYEVAIIEEEYYLSLLNYQNR
jgi:hypothetical protein